MLLHVQVNLRHTSLFDRIHMMVLICEKNPDKGTSPIDEFSVKQIILSLTLKNSQV